MIKSIVQKIMIKQFSKYINGIQYNKLTIEVLGGFFSIQNISLNHAFFNALETPVHIAFSHIGKLTIEAPLTKLSSVPVAVTVEDVFVIGQLKKQLTHLNQVTKEELLQKYIRQTFDLLVSKMKNVDKEEGTFDKLGKKIVDNLKFHIKNIHVRIQEQNQLHCYSFGVSLKQLTFGTTDRYWKPVFVEREKSKAEEPIYKLMNVEKFKIYWQSLSKGQKQYQFLMLTTPKARIEAMRKYVLVEEDSLLSINCGVKLTVNPASNTKLPLVDIDINLEPININFSKQKIVEVLDFTTSCIKHNEIMLKTLLQKAKKKPNPQQEKQLKPLCLKYVEKILQKEGKDKDKDKKSKKDQQTSMKDNINFSPLFNEVSIENLYQWAMEPIKSRVQVLREKQIRKEKSSWFSSTQYQLNAQEKKQLQRVLNQLAEDSITGKGRPTDCLLLQLSLKLKGLYFHFYDENQDNKLKTIELRIQSISCNLQKSHDNSWLSVNNKIKQIVADLRIEEQGVIKDIHLMENLMGQRQEYLLESMYHQSVKVGAKSTQMTYFTDVTLGKTIFTYKKQYLKMFSSFFSLPDIDQQLQNQAFGKLELLRAESSSDDEDNPIIIQKFYNINLSLMSPSFVLPLTDSSCWYLDLGTISMKSQSTQDTFIYPFKLRQLNMRYINSKDRIQTSQLISKQKDFFPIINNINIDVNMTTFPNDNNITFDVFLEKIEISATRQEFVNLLNVKKFLVGEEQDQLIVLEEKRKNKEDIINKARLKNQLSKRGKYLHNWVQYCCFFVNNSIYFYPNQTELTPDSILSLRGAKLTKNINQFDNNIHYQLQISTASDVTYLQFSDKIYMDRWEEELARAVLELKNKDELLLGDQLHKKKKHHHVKKQETVVVNLSLRQMSWNYLNSKGESFMKIELQNIKFKMNEHQQRLSTTLIIQEMSIYDRVYEYHNKKYQHFLKSQNLSVTIDKVKQKLTKISPVVITTHLDTLDLNWKPDALLMLIKSIKQFMDIKPMSKNKDKQRQQIIREIKEDPNFVQKTEKYGRNGANYSIKQKREDYLKMNSKDDEIYVKIQTSIDKLNINFIHRQSHMPMFQLDCQQLYTLVTFAKAQKYVEGHLNTLNLYEIFGYPQKKYSVDAQYEPFCLVQKQASCSKEQHALKFRYSQYLPQEIPNKDKVDTFMSLAFAPLTIHYFQEVTFRLIDYSLIQIILLLTNPDMITANQAVLQQLMKDDSKKSLQNYKYFIEDEFQNVVKRFLDPYFMDYNIILDNPDIVLSPTKDYPHYFNVNPQKIQVNNCQTQQTRRFAKSSYDFKELVYQEEVLIKISNIKFESINGKYKKQMVKDYFSCAMVVNRLLFEEDIIGITPELVGYDRTISIVNQITAVHIPELSKVLYQNLMRLPNFNLTFVDAQQQLFIHNYKITKTLSPKPIQYSMTITDVTMTAQHSIDQNKDFRLKLFDVNIHNFGLSYRRDEKLNSNVEINIQQAHSNYFQYGENFNEEPQVKTLAKIDKAKHKDHCYFLVKLANSGKIDIQGLIEQSQFFLNLGVINLISDWVQVDDSVFADHPKLMRPIYCVIRMPKLMLLVQNHNNYDSNLKTLGEVVIQVSRNKCESQNYLKQAYENKNITPDYIENLREFMSIKLSMGVEFFNTIKGRDRKLIDKVGIEFRQLDFFKIRKNKLSRAMTRRLLLTNLQGSVSIDDVMLFKSISDTSTWGSIYQRHFKEYLQAQLGKVDLLDNKIYQDVFKQAKILEQMVFKLQSIKLYLISKQNSEYLPIFRLFTNEASINLFVNVGSTVITGQFSFEVKYFNDQIFRWQPLVQPVKMKWNILNNQHEQQAMELDVINDIFINFSSQNAVSIKKFIKGIQDTVALMEKGQYKPDVAQEFLSRYVIKNQTGYPIEIFDQRNTSVFVIMPEEKVNYTSKAIMRCFFEQNKLSETISFNILHPQYEFLPISGISLQNHKSFDVELYTAKGVKLPEKNHLRLTNEVKGCKKIITVQSKKYITDYSAGVQVTHFYPFDHDDNISVPDLHRGFKANFYKNLQSQRFFYMGKLGHLTIRKKFLVYNYTPIPLDISGNTCIPGTFVGIDGHLKIQGVPHQDSPLKVVFNQKKNEFYIYSISYLIDYVGFNITFETNHEIMHLYSHQFKQKNRRFSIYLLPSITTNFAVMMSRSSTKKELQGKLAKQVFNLADGKALHYFSCFSRLETFCEQNIKDFRKVIELTSAYTICNDTEYVISYKQQNTKDKINILKPNENKPFLWPQHCLQQMIEVSIISEKQQWKVSSPLPITEVTETFVIRSLTNEAKYKVLGLELEETNNITFIHIVDASEKIEILNSIPHSTMSIYQQVIFENKNIILKDPQNYICNVPYKIRKNFGYELPRHNHTVTVQIQLEKEHYNWRCPSFSLPDIENNLIQKIIEIKGKDSVHKLVISLSFDKNTKTIEFSLKKKQIFNKIVESQVKCKLKNINLSLVGMHEQVRKQIINVCISDVAVNFYLNEKSIETSISAQGLKIENTLKADPYFVSLFRQAEKSNKPAFLFAVKKSRTNTRLLYYIGCSIRRSVLTVTSEELAILEENMNRIMERLDQKSDTNIFLNLDNKFTPQKIISDQKLYFSQAQIHPIRLIVTYKHVNNWGGALLKALSINECKVKVDGKKLSNFVCKDILDFATKTGTHFKEGFQNEIFSMIGSLALLGSPLNLASKIGGGISNLITLPADGFEDQGVLGVGKGLALGTGSLVSNTIQGAFGTVESITGTIGNGISGLASYDKDFEKKRQQLKNERVDHVGEGLLSGGKSIVNGFFTGVTGLVKEPMKGAKSEGVGGFFKGGLKGLTGLIVKPVSGVIDATSKTAQGIKNTTKVFSSESKELRMRIYTPRPFYGASRQIRTYDSTVAEWNLQLGMHKSRFQNLSWAGLYELKNGQILCVTYEYLLIVSGKSFDVQEQIPASQMVSVSKDGVKLNIFTKLQNNQRGKMVLQLRKIDQCLTELRRVHQHYHKNYQIGLQRKTPI